VCPGLEGLPHIQTAVQSLRDAYPWGGIHDSQ
jgi:hypothetical protein